MKNEETKFLLFPVNVIVYLQRPKELIVILLKAISEFRMGVGF